MRVATAVLVTLCLSYPALCVEGSRSPGGTNAPVGAAVEAVPTGDGWTVLEDGALLRLDSGGRGIWRRVFADAGPGGRRGRSLSAAPGGGFFVAGTNGPIGSGAGGDRLWLARFDAEGRGIWEASLGAADSENGVAIVPDGAGGAIALATSFDPAGARSELWLVRVDASGSVVKQSRYGRDLDPVGASLTRTPRGWLVCATLRDGGTAPGGDIWLIEVDAELSPLWQKVYRGPGEVSAAGAAVSEDGSLVIAASRTSPQQSGAWILRVAADGGTDGPGLFQVLLPAPAASAVHTVRTTTGNGTLLVGERPGRDSGIALWIAALDAGGRLSWQRSLAGERDLSGRVLAGSADGGLLFGGRSRAPGGSSARTFLVKTDASGHPVIGGAAEDLPGATVAVESRVTATDAVADEGIEFTVTTGVPPSSDGPAGDPATLGP